MATFKNRALTLATAGLLTSSPLALATEGLLQPAVVTPVIQITQPQVTGGVSTHIDYRIPYAAYSNLTFTLVVDAEGRVEIPKPSTFTYISHPDITLAIQSQARQSFLFTTTTQAGITLRSSTEARTGNDPITENNTDITLRGGSSAGYSVPGSIKHDGRASFTLAANVDSSSEAPTATANTAEGVGELSLTGTHEVSSSVPASYKYKATGNVATLSGEGLANYRNPTIGVYSTHGSGIVSITGAGIAHAFEAKAPVADDDAEIIAILSILLTMDFS